MEKSLATARWAANEEIFETRYDGSRGGKDADLLIGETDFLVEKWRFDRTKQHFFVGARTDQHALVCMGARGGKGTSIIVPNLLFWEGSCVVVDPKGENATLTAARRGKGVKQQQNQYTEGDFSGLNQSTLVLDPFSVAQVDDEYRATFNPLDAIHIDDDEAIDEAGRIADAIVVQDGDKDSHWNESARYMIKGVVLHVLTDPDFEGMRNLITVRKLLVSGDWQGVEAIQQANSDKDPDDDTRIFEADPFDMLWQGMLENQACEGVIKGVGRSFLSMSEKERSSVLSTATRNTEFIDSPQMRRSLESSNFSLSELKTSEKGVSLFLSLPTRYMGTHHRWLRMLVTLTLDEMEKVSHQPKCGYPVLMVLDEFPGLGRMKRIEDATSQIPGYGVKLAFICQSLSQLKEVYKDNWETFIACSGITLFAANQDEFTLKYITKRLGESEITRTTRSTGRNRGYSILKPWTLFTGSQTGRNEQLHKRSLLTEDEVSRTFAANQNTLLAFIAGLPPMVLNRVPYYQTQYIIGKTSPHPDHPETQDILYSSKGPQFWYDKSKFQDTWLDRFDISNWNERAVPESSGYTEEGNIIGDAFTRAFWLLILLGIWGALLPEEYKGWGLLGIMLFALSGLRLVHGLQDRIVFSVSTVIGVGFFAVILASLKWVWDLVSNLIS